VFLLGHCEPRRTGRRRLDQRPEEKRLRLFSRFIRIDKWSAPRPTVA
jgi:hypothetical protein